VWVFWGWVFFRWVYPPKNTGFFWVRNWVSEPWLIVQILTELYKQLKHTLSINEVPLHQT